MAILRSPFPRRTQQCVAVGARSDVRSPGAQRLRVLFKSSAGNLCGDSRQAEEADRVTKCPAVVGPLDPLSLMILKIFK